MDNIISLIKESIIKISKKYHSTSNLGNEINTINSSGDSQKKLDILSDEILTKNLQKETLIKAIASEEKPNLLINNKNGKYLVVYDPLDGSKNIELNLITGTIFGIFDFSSNKISGKNIIASGYALYGPTTQFVLAQEKVELFQLKENNFIKIKNLSKNVGKNYHINSSKINLWDEKTSSFVSDLNKNNYNSRWLGCMVADVHYIILKGGYFLYPSNSKNLDGKIRLLYEAMPMAFIVNKLGGNSDDFNDKLILDYDVKIENLHQKIPIRIKL